MEANQEASISSNAMDFSNLASALNEFSAPQQQIEEEKPHSVKLDTDILMKEIKDQKKLLEAANKTKGTKNKKVERSKGYIDKLAQKEKKNKKMQNSNKKKGKK